eukprot:365120-Chlamydomonas_euryale.AAC.7
MSAVCVDRPDCGVRGTWIAVEVGVDYRGGGCGLRWRWVWVAWRWVWTAMEVGVDYLEVGVNYLEVGVDCLEMGVDCLEMGVDCLVQAWDSGLQVYKSSLAVVSCVRGGRVDCLTRTAGPVASMQKQPGCGLLRPPTEHKPSIGDCTPPPAKPLLWRKASRYTTDPEDACNNPGRYTILAGACNNPK